MKIRRSKYIIARIIYDYIILYYIYILTIVNGIETVEKIILYI
jgi:hypothetical protein